VEDFLQRDLSRDALIFSKDSQPPSAATSSGDPDLLPAVCLLLKPK
jgi:hypothetical protein